MSRIVQEKFEIRPPANTNDDGHNGWKSDASARTRKGLQQRHDDGKYQTYRADLNQLPPGMNIDDQSVREINPMRTVTGGTDDVTDNPQGKDFVKGYVGMHMRGTDDMYSNEHVDVFYSSVEVDGVEGYLERGNTLDRN
jgi:hypothetical protein